MDFLQNFISFKILYKDFIEIKQKFVSDNLLYTPYSTKISMIFKHVGGKQSGRSNKKKLSIYIVTDRFLLVKYTRIQQGLVRLALFQYLLKNCKILYPYKNHHILMIFKKIAIFAIISNFDKIYFSIQDVQICIFYKILSSLRPCIKI